MNKIIGKSHPKVGQNRRTKTIIFPLKFGQVDVCWIFVSHQKDIYIAPKMKVDKCIFIPRWKISFVVHRSQQYINAYFNEGGTLRSTDMSTTYTYHVNICFQFYTRWDTISIQFYLFRFSLWVQGIFFSFIIL